MQRYSLYIDHQLVSTLIRELETAVQTCYEELDEEYEPHQLRTHIYEEFVFHITALYNTKYALKEEYDVKHEDLKKYYELTAKLEGIGAKHEHPTRHQHKIHKGRPNKNQVAEDHFITHVKEKLSVQGKLHYTKKQLDEIYLPLLENKPKSFPTNNYFRFFKKHELFEISITNRNGIQKSVRQFFDKKSESESFCKKEDETENHEAFDDHQIEESDLNSTSELEHELQEQYDNSGDFNKNKSAKLSNQNPFGWKPKPRSCNQPNSKKEKKAEKKLQKSMKVENFFNENSDCEKIDHHWQDLSMSSDELFEKVKPNPDIYDNSKSFE